ncbi:uncharacterized protein B0H64DRAFT_126916 [Chaetomium fimeti]|uniref:Uncharacterized protein n=1 Tax=Chaetomium fimeti TaxID=1854472 RepID=A0AAE0LU27_9PEZI|nr:hypothetical protein B0H64DRAFT_126916 [Chaetomium fimeti]
MSLMSSFARGASTPRMMRSSKPDSNKTCAILPIPPTPIPRMITLPTLVVNHQPPRTVPQSQTRRFPGSGSCHHHRVIIPPGIMTKEKEKKNEANRTSQEPPVRPKKKKRACFLPGFPSDVTGEFPIARGARSETPGTPGTLGTPQGAGARSRRNQTDRGSELKAQSEFLIEGRGLPNPTSRHTFPEKREKRPGFCRKGHREGCQGRKLLLAVASCCYLASNGLAMTADVMFTFFFLGAELTAQTQTLTVATPPLFSAGQSHAR